MIFKTSKKACEVMFYMSKYIYYESLFNTLYIEIKTNVKKIPPDKIKAGPYAKIF